MKTHKAQSGGKLPEITLPLLSGGTTTLGEARTPGHWQIVFVYRGLHCPLCKKYLARLEELKDGFAQAKAEIIAVSGDPREKAAAMAASASLSFPIAYGLSTEQMDELGLYISNPRSKEETDRPFAEPATFGVNTEGETQLIEISNTPFNRADLSELLETIEWVEQNDYPIRGTYQKTLVEQTLKGL